MTSFNNFCVSGLALFITEDKPESGAQTIITTKTPFNAPASAPHRRLLPAGFFSIKFSSLVKTASSPSSVLGITTTAFCSSFSSVVIAVEFFLA